MGSLLGSRRSRIYKEPKSRSLSNKRKQRVRFRSRYAGSVAKQWSKFFINGVLTVAVIGGGFWGVTSSIEFWETSSTLRVQEVIFSNDIPTRLRSNFPIKSNDHLLKLRPSTLEQEFLTKFPELKSLAIRRTLFRNVSVSGKLRIPVARIPSSGEGMALDINGFSFPLSDNSLLTDHLPMIETPNVEDRRLLLTFLARWKKDLPLFYSLIKKIETDRMREFIVELSDGVLIDWGPIDEADIMARAKRVMRLRELFKQTKNPAWLTFVTNDRLVMDRNWQKMEPTK